MQSRDESKRLYQNTLESIDRYLKYDRDQKLEKEGSILDYFEGLGGYEALARMA